MPGNEDLDSPSAISLGVLSSDPSASQNSDQEEEPHSAETDHDATPPLGVELTLYRLVNLMIIISFGITKAIIAYRGQSIAPTTLELVVGTVLAAVLYWIGLYEAKKFEWLLQVDMAPAIGYSIKRFIGGVLGVLFGGDGMLIIIWLSTLPVIPFVCFSGFVLRRSVGAWVYNFLTVFGLIFWRSTRTRRVRGRTQLWGWQGVMGFLAEYGPTAPLAEQYGRLSWFGAVGTVVGLLCGITLYLSPQAVFYFEGLYICRQERLTTPLQQEISDL